MSWKFGGIYIRKKKDIQIAELINKLELSLEKTVDTVSFMDVTSSSFFDTGIAEKGEIVFIQNNFLAHDCSFKTNTFWEFDELLLAASNDLDILCFFLMVLLILMV
jgi:hypothetical protein